MARTVVDLDDNMVAEAMRIFGTRTKAKAVRLAMEDAVKRRLRQEGFDALDAMEPSSATPFEYPRTDEDSFTRALEIQRHALNTGFHRALSLPDLLIAATAEQNRVTILHYDGDFDMIASLTGQPAQGVAPPGSADH
ncbi:type II toxin-antitoxin system VapB family antitoxin [Streptomyces triticirhizae]|uniref:type II toxin-antitoxin system VapB family antitoxin n=1 Tax=Streptomyces triticirhizae TaxID=2483353 RepID=UPI001F1DA727|nr:type II toxin-antitoxin system VapB family antitoxin [Streptomyces triticirhizae]